MKVLLVNPPIPLSFSNKEFYLPSGLLYIAAVLKQGGHTVSLLDMKTFRVEEREFPQKYCETALMKAIRSFSPGVVAFGCLFSGNFHDVIHFSKLCKEECPTIPVVIGGIHPTIYPFEILMNCPSIDWVVLGEGEQSFLSLMEAFCSRRKDVSDIDGIAYRSGGRVVINPKKNYIDDLDVLPFPAYDIVSLQDYHVDTSLWHNPRRLPINTSVPIISSRSCPHSCPFCSMYMAMGPKWRTRSAANVVDEIEYVYRTFGHQHYSFMDDNFSLSKRRTIDICEEIIRRNLLIQFETPNGLSVNTLDKDVLDAMVAAGLTRISLAIESGSDYIRNRIMKKNLSREKIFDVVSMAKSFSQLFVKAFFVIGAPEETEETLQDTFTMIQEINVDKIHLMNMVPFPSTKIYEQAVKDNLLIDLNPEDLYCSDALYVVNYGTFFIKPYSMTLDALRTFRTRCEQMIAEQELKRRLECQRERAVV
ncbi:MAG: radical SAM protein [Desulfuromonadales bacterium]